MHDAQLHACLRIGRVDRFRETGQARRCRPRRCRAGRGSSDRSGRRARTWPLRSRPATARATPCALPNSRQSPRKSCAARRGRWRRGHAPRCRRSRRSARPDRAAASARRSTSASRSAVISETSVAETSTPYSSRTISWMSRVVIPLAYRARIFSSKPGTRRWCFSINCGSNVPSRSRGVAIVRSPLSPRTVFCERPLRRFGVCLGRSASDAAASTVSGASAADSFVATANGRAAEMHVHLRVQHPLQGRFHHQPHQIR